MLGSGELNMFKQLRKSRLFAAFLSILIVVPPAIAIVRGATLAGSYGTILFLGIPFALGLVTVLLYEFLAGPHAPGAMGTAMLSILMVGSVLLMGGIEGAVCLLMALVVALPLAFLGASLGIMLLSFRRTRAIAACLAFAMPLTAPYENQWHRGPGHFVVHSSIEIAAPPERVWEHVIAFSEIPEKPTSPMLRTGIAYPTHATISGAGVGAVRECVFTTGAFEEPIDVWDAPHRLHFSVAKQPPLMHEMSWVPDLQPPHIAREYLRSRQGQFVLTPLPNGHTLLEGTTWYDLQYWPSSYWHLWSDAIIHRIHMRVLEHIKAEVER
jgi:hypothetical protein